jgi:hypothetical protein
LASITGKDGRLVRAKFQAYAEYMAEHGKMPTPEWGHWLHAPYDDLFEFKPKGHRILAFRDGQNLYVVSGAKKANKKKQDADYLIALNLRANYYDGLAARQRRLKRTQLP